MNTSKYFENRDCEYYPCHDIEHINCLFCYCPLYTFEDCPGDFTWVIHDIKDCSKCTVAHDKDNGWEIVQEYLT